jgi:hypothetical protein
VQTPNLPSNTLQAVSEPSERPQSISYRVKTNKRNIIHKVQHPKRIEMLCILCLAYHQILNLLPILSPIYHRYIGNIYKVANFMLYNYIIYIYICQIRAVMRHEYCIVLVT